MPSKIDVSDEPLSVQTLYPSKNFWLSENEKRSNKEELIDDRIDEDTEIVVVHDTDADGLGTAVMALHRHPEAALIPRHHSEDIEISDVGKMLTEKVDGGRVVITDNGCDGSVEEYIRPYTETFDEVFVFDHHSWPDNANDVLDKHGVSHVIDGERCAAMIVHDEYLENPPGHLTEFAAVTQDHDLWIKEDERSDGLANASYAMDDMEYIQVALEKGVEMLNDEQTRNALINQRKKTQEELNLALSRSTFYDVNDVTVAITYGKCPQSDTGAVLYGEYGADVVCMMFPDGGLSFRSDDNGFALQLAKYFSGGGHPNAAGGYFEQELVENDNVSYEEYWGSMGRIFHEDLLEAVREEICGD